MGRLSNDDYAHWEVMTTMLCAMKKLLCCAGYHVVCYDWEVALTYAARGMPTKSAIALAAHTL